MKKPAHCLVRARPCALALLLLVAAAGGCADGPTAPPGFQATGTAGRWTTASPAEAGLDPDVLVELGAAVDSGAAGAVSSLLVLRNGTLVYERYWDGWTPDDLHVVNSVTKSVVSLLVGIARDEGLVDDLDREVLSWLAAQDAPPWPHGRPDFTLRHALAMRTGLAWDEISTNYRDEANPVRELATSADWVRFVLELEPDTVPGARFAYNSGVSVLLSAVLGEATGSTAEAYAADRLFAPLGIDTWRWSAAPGGLSNGGWGLELRPRDMAAIGQLVLDGGDWNGRRVVSGAWIEESAERRTRFVDGTGYGYQWWLPPLDDGARVPLAAWGYGGQYIVVVPSLDMVLVTTAENFESRGFSPYRFAEYLYRMAGARVPF